MGMDGKETMTKTQRRALKSLLENAPMTLSEFAQALWPGLARRCEIVALAASAVHLCKLKRLRWIIQRDTGDLYLSLQGFGALRNESKHERTDAGN